MCHDPAILGRCAPLAKAEIRDFPFTGSQPAALAVMQPSQRFRNSKRQWNVAEQCDRESLDCNEAQLIQEL
jgi:hypothetical protein